MRRQTVEPVQYPRGHSYVLGVQSYELPAKMLFEEPVKHAPPVRHVHYRLALPRLGPAGMPYNDRPETVSVSFYYGARHLDFGRKSAFWWSADSMVTTPAGVGRFETKFVRLSGPIRFVGKLLETWRLEPEDAVWLLGGDQDYIGRLMRGSATLAGRDIKDRIAYLFQIRQTLSSLFRDESTENAWLREQHDLLNGRAPLQLLREGSMEAMLTVKEYVDAAAGR